MISYWRVLNRKLIKYDLIFERIILIVGIRIDNREVYEKAGDLLEVYCSGLGVR